MTLVSKLAYGHQILSDDDEYIKLAEDASLAITRAGAPGTKDFKCVIAPRSERTTSLVMQVAAVRSSAGTA
jgi:hypothetical protein